MNSNETRTASRLGLFDSSPLYWTLGAAILVVWVWSAISPMNGSDWLLENFDVVLTLAVVIIFRKKLWMSRWSAVSLSLFLMLHLYAAHYSYDAPIGYWIGHLMGTSRNMFDRVVHGLFGVLIFFPTRDVLGSMSKASPRVSMLLAFLAIMAASALYEIFEWGSVWVFTPSLVSTFLGFQGDMWDTQEDMAMAMAGALITWAILFVRLKYLEYRPMTA